MNRLYWLYNWLAIPFMVIAGFLYVLSICIFRVFEFLFVNTAMYHCTPRPVVMLYRTMMCLYCFVGPAADKEDLKEEINKETGNV